MLKPWVCTSLSLPSMHTHNPDEFGTKPRDGILPPVDHTQIAWGKGWSHAPWLSHLYKNETSTWALISCNPAKQKMNQDCSLRYNFPVSFSLITMWWFHLFVFVTPAIAEAPIKPYLNFFSGLWWLSGKASACQCSRHVFDPWIEKILWRRK